VNDTNNELPNQISNKNNQGEYCCAGKLCGMKGINNGFIPKKNFRHKCVKCKGVMHGGICGAEASTVLNLNCGHNDVICFICIEAHNKTIGMYYWL